jgi:radical SAM superfamily enzyme YgiQ (UPF0313 family)
MEKIVFIEPNPPDFHIFSRMIMPRLGTVLLGTTLKQHGYEVKSYVECVSQLDLEDVFSADAVGISTITSTAPRSYEIASLIRKMGIPVFMGGPHVSFMPDEALEHCDYVLRGEADDCIVDFIKALEKGTGFEKIPGLSYRWDGKVVHNKGSSFCKNMDSIPCPDFKIISSLETQGLNKLNFTPIMTSRGCPYDCSFCSVTSMFGHKFRWRGTERVLEELRTHREQEGDWVFFYDDIFNANKERTKKLLQAMIENDLTPPWTAQVRVEVAKDLELVELMRRANCRIVFIGFESINPETLKAYNKRQSLEDIERCIKTLHKNRIRIHGMFVLGSDEDTTDTIHETVKFAKKNDLDTIQFLILTPLPGTKQYQDFESQGRIISHDWSLYGGQHVVYEPMRMSYYELQNETLRATKQFYSLGQIGRRILRFDMLNVSLKTYARDLANKWQKKNQYFIEYTKALTNAGRTIELATKKTAEDIKEKFRKLELSGTLVQRIKTHKTF